jgi:hypothetical protein
MSMADERGVWALNQTKLNDDGSLFDFSSHENSVKGLKPTAREIGLSKG